MNVHIIWGDVLLQTTGIVLLNWFSIIGIAALRQ